MSERESTKPGSPEYFVHESSYVDKGAVIGKGTRIWHFCHVLAGASIGERCSFGQNCSIAAGVVIGNNVKVQNNVSIYEGTTIEDDVFLGPSCVLTNVTNPRSQVLRRALYEPTLLRRGCSIGANATIICGITLGRYAFVAAGAVVAKDVPDYALMVGIPARQKGWMSRHGHLLGKPDADGVMVCPESGLRYQAKSVDCESLIVNRETDEPRTANHEPRTTNHEPRTTQVLRCLDLDEEAPLPEDLAVGKVVYDEVKGGKL